MCCQLIVKVLIPNLNHAVESTQKDRLDLLVDLLGPLLQVHVPRDTETIDLIQRNTVSGEVDEAEILFKMTYCLLDLTQQFSKNFGFIFTMLKLVDHFEQILIHDQQVIRPFLKYPDLIRQITDVCALPSHTIVSISVSCTRIVEA